MIEFRNVTKRYGNILALEDVSFKIPKGEIFTIIGPNGSGKTTILRIMGGIDEPSSGKVYFDGVEVDGRNMNDVRRRVTLVFQKTVLFNTSVYKNLAYGLKIRGYARGEIDRRVKEALKVVRLEGYQRRRARSLSGGEQQRVSLARALTLNTEVLLLDEPTANLDPRQASIIEETVSLVNRERGTTVVMATHNMFQVEALTKRIALLIGGKIKQIGSPQEIFMAPSEHLASFARLENVFSGFSRLSEEGTSLIDVEGKLAIEAAVRKEGKVTVFVRPEDIILSMEKIRSSARNVFKGRVISVTDLGFTIKLRVKAGKEFVVHITKRSFEEMKLNVGSEVFLAFKATSVQVL